MNTLLLKLNSYGVLSAVGNTPLIMLNQIFKDARFKLYAKLEGLNPGGSSKDRPALNTIRHAIEADLIDVDTVIIESSSGNMGVGLAMACSYLGLRFICVVDPKTTASNIRLLEAYGAEVDMVRDPDPLTGEFLQARIDRVRELLVAIDNSFWPDQYSNEYNPMAHYATMREITASIGHEPDYLFCATSTCGTMRGCAEYIRYNNQKTRLIAVDAIGSVIFSGKSAKRLIPGHGAARRPSLYQPGLVERCVHVSDLDCVIGCRLLARREAILAGGSSGAVIMAIDQIRHDIAEGATCVAIFPDRGERYLDTIYSDAWVEQHFDNVAYLWKDSDSVGSYAL